MSEVGDFEQFSAPAPKESSEHNDEQFREQMAAAQAAQHALKKEEGQAKAQDDNIAQIIVGFLNDGHTDLFLLISRCVAQNIPSELILAVLSLVDERSSKEVVGYLEGQAAHPASEHLVDKAKGHFNSLSEKQKGQIDTWIERITSVGLKRPHRSLESLVVKKSEGSKVIREISPTFVQLSAFIMRNYFSDQKIPFEFEELYAFMQTVYVELIRQLEEIAAGQKRLETSEDED